MKKSIKILCVLVLFIGFFVKTFSQNCTSLNYGSSLPINSIDEEIKNVTISTLNNTSSCATLAGGIGSILNRYSNYTGQITSPTLIQSVSYSLSITLFECGAIQNLGCVNVYIDYNQNGLFTDAGENVYSAASILFTLTGTLVSTSITIPVNAMLGTTRMRVIGSYGATMTPTGSYNYGETEDYCVTIGGSVPTTPSNDLCSGATSISCATSSLAGTTVGSVSEPPPAGASVSNYGVWYKFTGNGQQTTISSDADALFDQEMVILTGSSCGSFSILASQDNSGSGGTETYSFTTTNAQQYYVYIAHFSTSSNTTGNFTISRSCSAAPPTPPSNDLCSGATIISCATSSLAGTTVGSVSEPPPAGAFVSNYGVWYKFIGDGQQTTISSVADALFDQEMVILTGSSCGSFSILASQDNSGSGGTETYSFTTTNAQQYYVYIAHFSTSSNTTGNFTISRSCSTAPPINSCTQLNFGSSQANFSDDEEIFNVTFGSLNNTSNCSSIAPGPGSIKNMYSNYTGSLMTPTISVGSTYMLSVTLSECGTFTYTGGVSVYIDYNANGVFTDQGENVWNNPNCDFTFGGTTYSSNILIPANTTLGYKRMRVIAAYSGTMSPTGSYSYGETEDYCIEISPNDGTSITTQNLFDLNVIVYPNPTSDQITIQLSTNNNYKILILNALGQVIYTKDAEINNSLDLINFDSGLYFLKVIDKNLTLYTTRIIKK